MTSPDPIKEGSLVEVRQRRFAVVEVRANALPHDALRGVQAPQQVVALTSVEDDAYGEELEVVWELEPGARQIDAFVPPTPDGFDEPERLRAFLDAVRWGAAASADRHLLLAPFRSGVQVEDYQLDPVARAIRMPRVNLLIADDVGLGKTIEAGLVAQELILRHRVRTVLVVCPSALQVQWRDQMRDKFGLEFRIVDAELMHDLRRSRGLHVNPWQHFPRLITSIDCLKRDRPLRLFRDLLPGEDESPYPRRFDLLIVDEAHNIAPGGRGQYAVDSQRTRAIRALAPHFEHKLFLSATPHNGYPESFTALLELLDDQRFARGITPPRDAMQRAMVRRLKSELDRRWDGSARFAQRQLNALTVAYTSDEIAAYGALRRYVAARLEAATGVERMAMEFVAKLLKKRFFSSPAAFQRTLACHTRTLRNVPRGSAPGPRSRARPLRIPSF